MKTVGNIIWILFGGIWIALGWLFFGAILCITIIGIPFGLQAFKFARVTLTPFGKRVRLSFGSHPIANTLWAIFFGWEMAVFYIVMGIVNLVTIIGIPFALQSFKFAKLGFLPFGAQVEGSNQQYVEMAKQ